MSKQCKKCKEKIPSTLVIDNKRRNLSSRKFCLKCSPFGNHNTSPNDPVKRKKKGGYNNWSESSKDKNRAFQYWRRILRKEKLVDLFGGKCSKCGYNKCQRALQFHHTDPSQKCFEMSSREINHKSWQDIKKEASKCILVCANCHSEIEAESSSCKYAEYEQEMRNNSKNWDLI